MIATRSVTGADREFQKLWAGYTIGRVGSQITVLALPLTAVLVLGASATETGLLVAARMAPSAIASPLLGIWIDRVVKLPILIGGDILSMVVIGSIPVAAALGWLTLMQLYVVALLAGTAGVAIELSRSALVPSLVGRSQLVAANSRLQGSDAIAQVAGPSLGGSLVQAFTAPVAMAVDAASFLVSAVFLATIRTKEVPHPREPGSGVWRELTEGMRFVRGQTIVLRSVVAIALANIEWFAVQAILVVYATNELRLPPVLLGIAIAAIGPLGLVGAAIVGPLTRRIGIGRVMILALLLEAISRMLLPFAFGPPIVAAGVLMFTQALIGLTVPLWSVSSHSLNQAVTPDRLLGRVGATTHFIAMVVAPPSAIGAGLLADAIGLRSTLFIAGVIGVIAFVYLLASPVRSFRAIPDDLSVHTDALARAADPPREP